MEALQRWHDLFVLNKSKLRVLHFYLNRIFFIWKGAKVSEKLTLIHIFSMTEMKKSWICHRLGEKFHISPFKKKKSLHQKCGHVHVTTNLEGYQWKKKTKRIKTIKAPYAYKRSAMMLCCIVLHQHTTESHIFQGIHILMHICIWCIQTAMSYVTEKVFTGEIVGCDDWLIRQRIRHMGSLFTYFTSEGLYCLSDKPLWWNVTICLQNTISWKFPMVKIHSGVLWRGKKLISFLVFMGWIPKPLFVKELWIDNEPNHHEWLNNFYKNSQKADQHLREPRKHFPWKKKTMVDFLGNYSK